MASIRVHLTVFLCIISVHPARKVACLPVACNINAARCQAARWRAARLHAATYHPTLFLSNISFLVEASSGFRCQLTFLMKTSINFCSEQF